MSTCYIKIPETEFEIDQCHKIREYVLRESFADAGIDFKEYNKNHHVHGEPNVSLIFVVDNEVVGSVRMDKKFEHLHMPQGEIRLALFAISTAHQNKGLGKKFFNELKNWCKTNLIHTVHTNSRQSSHLFWSKMGFRDNIWDNVEIDETEIQMTLDL